MINCGPFCMKREKKSYRLLEAANCFFNTVPKQIFLQPNAILQKQALSLTLLVDSIGGDVHGPEWARSGWASVFMGWASPEPGPVRFWSSLGL